MTRFITICIFLFSFLSFYSQATFETKVKWDFMSAKYINVKVLPQFTFGGGVGGFNPPTQGGTITIDWGDLSALEVVSFQHNICSMDMTFGYSILPFQHSFDHVYSNPGIYNVTISAVDLSSATIFTNTGNAICNHTLIETGIPLNNNGFIGLKTQTCNNISIDSLFQLGVPYDFTDANGVTTTFYPNPNQNIDSVTSPICWNYQSPYTFRIYPIPAGPWPFTISVNPTWMAANGFSNANYSTGMNSHTPSPRWEIRGGDGLWISDPELCFTCPPSINQPINNFFGFDSVTLIPFVSNPLIPDFQFGFSSATANAILQNGNLQLKVCNMSCGNSDIANLQIQFPPNVIPITTNLINPSFTGGTLSFDIPNLNGTGCEDLLLPFNLPGSTPAGTQLTFNLQINNLNEINISNNNQILTCIVSNSQDPNFKEVNLPMALNPQITEELIYTIHFENEGNANASNIYITDEISDNLDLHSFKFLNTSHSCNFSIDSTSRILTVYFNSINLPSNQVDYEMSKGSFSYSLEEINNIALNDTIKNKASIYFDFNAPLITNETINVNLSAAELEMKNINNSLINLYPNPANDVLNISVSNDLINSSYIINDAIGRQIIKGKFDKNSIQFNSIFFKEGVYFIKLENGLNKKFNIIDKQ
jgi:uncharacterized repeat protein (TIGR01451 family)